MGSLDGKVVVVTGAGRGIGRGVALDAAREGAKVVVGDFGVAIDGSEPTSKVADAVVDEIRSAGGEAVANASSVAEMAGGESLVQAAIDSFGRLDAVVCVAGILRERMIFNMTEDDWDPVIATHLKGTFSLFRPASAIFRKQQSGTLIGFTSGAFAASVAQCNYSSAKGGVVSLVRSAAAGLYKSGVTANCIAPEAKSRMSGNVPMDREFGEPEDVAPLVSFLLGDRARHITGQVYSINGGKIGVYNQPRVLRSMWKQGRWTVDEIAAQLDGQLSQEPMPILEILEEMRTAAAAAKRAAG